MSRAETAVDSRVVREGHPMEAPGGDRSPLATQSNVCGLVGSIGEGVDGVQTAADGTAVGFLELPYELRLMIYELVLIDPDPIIISPQRRQIHARVCSRPAANASTYLRARRPTPEKYLERKEDRLCVGILRTCRQVDVEGTALLYGKNRFVVGHILPQGGLARLSTPAHLFLWHLRQTTLSLIPSITFCKGCLCTTWLLLDNREFKTDGTALRRVCFHGPARARPLPTPQRARQTLDFVHAGIFAGKGHPVFVSCPRCMREHRVL